jgi:trk system potassium uptake protein TrkA
MVERNNEIFIPNGDFCLQDKDVISVVTSSKAAMTFLRNTKFFTKKARNIMIVGGGETTVYTTFQLLDMGINVKIVEKDRERCKELCEILPQATIICGDGTDRDLLIEEEIENMDAFVAWTNFDEENVMLALYAKSVSKAKVISNIHRINYDKIIHNMDIGSALYPRNITSEYIVRYVRAMQNSMGSNVETLYQLIEDKVEALEFIVTEDAKDMINKPLSDLNLRDDVLICGITRKGKVITPQGQDVLLTGDSVVIVTTAPGLRELHDVLKVKQ